MQEPFQERGNIGRGGGARIGRIPEKSGIDIPLADNGVRQTIITISALFGASQLQIRDRPGDTPVTPVERPHGHEPPVRNTRLYYRIDVAIRIEPMKKGPELRGSGRW